MSDWHKAKNDCMIRFVSRWNEIDDYLVVDHDAGTERRISWSDRAGSWSTLFGDITERELDACKELIRKQVKECKVFCASRGLSMNDVDSNPRSLKGTPQ